MKPSLSPIKTMPEMAAPHGEAPGHPGIEARWTGSCKAAIGTSTRNESRVWFTISHGILNEVYWPRIDNANLRDWGFVVTGPDGFFSEEKRHANHQIIQPDNDVPAYSLVNTHPDHYRITKRVLSDPASDAVLVDFEFEALNGKREDYRVFSLLSPHINNRGMGNSAEISRQWGRLMALAERDGHNLALAASVPLKQASVGYAGTSDGYNDLRETGGLRHEYSCATDGNLAVCTELDLEADNGHALLVLSFGHTPCEAALVANAALMRGYDSIARDFAHGWKIYHDGLRDLSHQGEDGGRLFHSSANVLRAHEDKTQPGAMIASLSIPWGDALGDDNIGGYHLVWPRDMVNSATARLALDDFKGARRALFFLDATQREDGGWTQNMWLDGQSYWTGQQMDETAFPITLAWRLHEADALEGYDPYPSLVRPAAAFLARLGPLTAEERWEENGGYSPSTLAVEIAALVCAATWAKERGDEMEARLLLEIADSWNAQIEDWTWARSGPLSKNGYYMRLGVMGQGDIETRTFPLRNQAPDARHEYGCSEIIDGGFLELVRYGLRSPDDSRIVATVELVDEFLKKETPCGASWHRYNNDGYGERPDGAPFENWGVGRLWPLLTGERAHYDFACGRDIASHLKALECFGRRGGLLSEQVWDSADNDEYDLHLGQPTGSARPLAWAHAEYLKLLRSREDNRVFDLLMPVHERYAKIKTSSDLMIWSFAHQIPQAQAAKRFRLQTDEAARIHWSDDNWATTHEDVSTHVGLGIFAYTFDAHRFAAGAQLKWTFYWTESNRWEGRDWSVSFS